MAIKEGEGGGGGGGLVPILIEPPRRIKREICGCGGEEAATAGEGRRKGQEESKERGSVGPESVGNTRGYDQSPPRMEAWHDGRARIMGSSHENRAPTPLSLSLSIHPSIHLSVSLSLSPERRLAIYALREDTSAKIDR